MNKRQHALSSMRIAGYHDDQRTRARLLVERRINRQAFDEAWSKGIERQRPGGQGVFETQGDRNGHLC